MGSQTKKVFLYVSESFGSANYTIWETKPHKTYSEYKLLGEIEVPTVSEEMLRELALENVNAEIAKAALVMKALNEKKQQLLSITHEVK